MTSLKKLRDTAMWVVIAGSGMLLTAGTVQALEESAQLKLGEMEYMGNCSACHGTNATGTGPVAEVLTSKPADLTQISKKFDGQFPTQHVYEIIDGRYMINPHGDKQMPVWGHRYLAKAHERAGEVPHDVDTQALAFGRIMSLVRYLESIQAN